MRVHGRDWSLLGASDRRCRVMALFFPVLHGQEPHGVFFLGGALSSGLGPRFGVSP